MLGRMGIVVRLIHSQSRVLNMILIYCMREVRERY